MLLNYVFITMASPILVGEKAEGSFENLQPDMSFLVYEKINPKNRSWTWQGV